MAIKAKAEEPSGATDEPMAASGAEAPTVASMDRTVAALKDGMTRAASSFERTQEQMKEGVDKAMKTAEELVAFGQGNLEAVIKSGQIWSTGMQDIGKQVAATAQASFEDAMATYKKLAAVKSLKDAIDLQTGLARATIEKTLAESGKITDASLKLTEQTLAPLTARMTLAVEKFAKPL